MRAGSRSDDGDFSENVQSYEPVQTFLGLVQTPSNSDLFRNGKDTDSVAGILFTDLIMNDSIQEKDKVQDLGGSTYIISGAGSQPRGVTGIRNHHIEFTLVADDGS